MAHHEPVEVDPEQVAHAEHLWSRFTVLTKYATIAVLITLATLGLVFIDW